MSYSDKDKQREYQRQWVANRRAEFFKDKSCVRCSSTDMLELDHIDRDTKVSHSIWSWSKARQQEEIAKCQVLCQSCHKEKTFAVDTPKVLGRMPHQHGTAGMYKNAGCRCDLCREWSRVDRQRYAR